jgi:phage-related protein
MTGVNNLFEVEFYEDIQGRQPVREALLELRDKARTSKDMRVQYEKVLTSIRALETYGTRVGEPHVKHIDGDIWELRPLSRRILFFYWRDKKFILLHHFVKKTRKTPAREIERARRNQKDFIERNP